LQYGDYRSGDGRTAFLASFTNYTHVRARAEDDVFLFEPGHLGKAQTSLYRQQNEGVITPARPCALIRRREHGVDFGTCEEGDQSPCKALARYGEYPLNLCGISRRFVSCEAKEGAQSRQ